MGAIPTRSSKPGRLKARDRPRNRITMTFDAAMRFQAVFCDRNGAPRTAACCRALVAALDEGSMTGRRARRWAGDPVRDALPLRLVAPFHALYRRGVLAAMDDVDAIRAAVSEHDAWIADWLDGPPQTNEAGRSATFMAALLVLASRFDVRFELLEIGASAGMNLLIDRYGYDLGGVTVGQQDSPLTIKPDWRGPPPPVADVRIAAVSGVDIAPIDASDPDAAERLIAYTWVDVPERAARIEAAAAMMAEQPVDLVQGDAADWLEAQLAKPQAKGVCRVVMHSVVWPYLDNARRARIVAALDLAGARATPRTPLAWLRMEWDSGHTPHRIRLKVWPGGEDAHLGNAHPHGAWVEWLT
jgi:hypothetical protein